MSSATQIWACRVGREPERVKDEVEGEERAVEHVILGLTGGKPESPLAQSALVRCTRQWVPRPPRDAVLPELWLGE